MQLAVCLCIYITKDHTQRGVEGQVCTLSAIGEGEGFGDGLCLSMKLLATFSPSTSTGSSKAFSKAQHPRLSSKAPSGPSCNCERDLLVCFVLFVREILWCFLSYIYIASCNLGHKLGCPLLDALRLDVSKECSQAMCPLLARCPQA